MATVVIKDFTPEVERALDQKSSLFLRTFAEDVVKNSERKTPKKTGNE